ncbi:MAG TPA: phenylalanine--tRNA ligase subunit beta [Candidatus Hydrothermia bacterium]|nr:phenylalanine--tRNA ligase subunit beta [Candidatus Hydrothermia bacterium]
MRVSYNLLKEYIQDLKLSPLELKELFPYLGIEVVEFKFLAEGLEEHVVSGVIENLSNIKDDLTYKVAEVSIGAKSITVVSTAPNLREKMKVIVALPGARLGNNVVHEKEVRGVKSQGNVLSLEEVGLPISSSGVYELPGDFPVGVSPLEYLGLNDWIYDLYIFPNRPDLLGIIGLSMEISAYVGGEILWPKVGVLEECHDIPIIEVLDKDSCPVYTGRIIKNITVKESPFELQRKLILLGQRPINNIVDITNFVMFEFGQPIHAFDAAKVERKIMVRRANPGEKILCLDGLERELNPEILVIADAQKPIAVAGVIGAEESGVTGGSSTIIVESAYFDRVRVRKAESSLGLTTESSRRFGRGGDPSIVEVASRRVAYLIKQLAGGTVCKINEVKSKNFEQEKIKLYFKDLNRMFGQVVEPEVVRKIIDRLDFAVHGKEDHLEVVVPLRRRDIEEWEDLSEEILKIYGYDKINSMVRNCSTFSGKKLKSIDRKLKVLLANVGFFEVKTVEFANPEELQSIGGLPRDFVRIRNPLNNDMCVLRTSLVAGLLRVASNNLRRGVSYAKIFEVGKVFRWSGEENLPEERMMLGLCVAGEVSKTWDRSERNIDMYDLLAGFQVIREKLEPTLEVVPEDLAIMGLSNGGAVLCDGRKVGYLGEVSGKLRKMFDIKSPVFVLELDLSSLKFAEIRYKEIPSFPSTSRDLSIIIQENDSISPLIRKAAETLSPILEDYEVIDIYYGKPIPEEKKSVTIKFIFRASDRTLTQEEVDTKFFKFVELLKNEGYEIRGLNG